MTPSGERKRGSFRLLAGVVATIAVAISSPALALDPALRVRTWGGGFGTVVSSVAGINCTNLPGATPDCEEPFPQGSVVTLTATAATHFPFSSFFGGWDGECLAAGLPTCTVILDRTKTVEARFYPADPLLTVAHSGDGSGLVTSAPSGIHCGFGCWYQFPRDTMVALTATPDPGSNFGGWSGACSGIAPTCTVRMDSTSHTATAVFYRTTPTLTVVKIGEGGTVSDDRGGILCGADCSEPYPKGSEITLSAQPDPGFDFQWIGPCKWPGQRTCVVEMNGLFELAFIRFYLRQWTLTVSVRGSGRVDGPGIHCLGPGQCSASYPSGTVLTFFATPDAGSSLYDWGGVWSCAISGGPSCSFTIDRDQTLSAVFGPTTNVMTVTKTGDGAGTVVSVLGDGSQDGRIHCGTDCTEAYHFEENAILEAIPEPGSTFTGWSGIDCPGTASCLAPMHVARNVTAHFDRSDATLRIARAGDGSGQVRSVPPGIECGPDCSETYASGTIVTLRATADSGSFFTGWAGACSGGVETCSLTLSVSSDVTANFSRSQPERFTLSVSRNGDGTGTVSSNSGRIYCGPDCSDIYSPGETETLNASAEVGSVFAGWSGACSGMGSCTVTMNASQSVTATFSRNQPQWFTLSVFKGGNGAGTVSSTSGRIYCGPDCSDIYSPGETETLNASAEVGSVFTGWSGACSGAGACQVTMDASKGVTANFSQRPSYTLTVSKTGVGAADGRVTSNPAGIDCGSDCSQSYASGTAVTLTAIRQTNVTFAGWEGACSGETSTCTTTMDADKSVTAVFTYGPR